MDNRVSLDDPDFCEWLISYAQNLDARLIVEDTYVISRLAKSMSAGRSTSFNQQEKEGGRNSALFLLKEEFLQHRRKESKMAKKGTCPRCGGSIWKYVKNGEWTSRCGNCGWVPDDGIEDVIPKNKKTRLKWNPPEDAVQEEEVVEETPQQPETAPEPTIEPSEAEDIPAPEELLRPEVDTQPEPAGEPEVTDDVVADEAPVEEAGNEPDVNTEPAAVEESETDDDTVDDAPVE